MDLSSKQNLYVNIQIVDADNIIQTEQQVLEGFYWIKG